AIPFFARARRHHVGVTGEHHQGAGAAAPCPKVGDPAAGDGLAAKACLLQALREQHLAVDVIRRDRRAGDQLAHQREYGAVGGHQALSRSLMLVLARVCASTRLTITAQARLCEPSSAGSEPGTTTEPDGMRPYVTLPVARS